MLVLPVRQAPTLVDLDGDGLLEIVCGTSSGDVIALRGKDGSSMPHFPVRTGERIISPVGILAFPEEDGAVEGEDGACLLHRTVSTAQQALRWGPGSMMDLYGCGWR